MKRMISLMLLFSLFLSGCSIFEERIKDPVIFYYVRDNYQKDMESVIDSEVREAAGHRHDLPYLLALYTMGPSREGLKIPFPKGTKVSVTEHSPDGLTLSLSEAAQNISDAEHTLASACLALTCMEMIDADKITVVCNERSVTIHRDNLLLNDPGQITQGE